MFKLMVINIRIVNKRNRLFITYLLLRVFYKKSSCLNPTAKVQKIRYMSFYYHGLYFDLQLHTFILSWFRYSDSFSKLVHLPSEPVYV